MVDAARIRKAQSGDEPAMRAVLSAVQHRIYRTAFFVLGNQVRATEATSELLTWVSRNLDTYDFHTGLDEWVTRLTAIHCVQIAGQLTGNGWLQLNGSDLSEGPLHNEFCKRLNGLSEDLRKIVIMRYVNGCTAEEIAGMNGLAVQVIDSALVQARLQMASVKAGFDGQPDLAVHHSRPQQQNVSVHSYPFPEVSPLPSGSMNRKTESEGMYSGPEVS